jgi:hypothetical protein
VKLTLSGSLSVPRGNCTRPALLSYAQNLPFVNIDDAARRDPSVIAFVIEREPALESRLVFVRTLSGAPRRRFALDRGIGPFGLRGIARRDASERIGKVLGEVEIVLGVAPVQLAAPAGEPLRWPVFGICSRSTGRRNRNRGRHDKSLWRTVVDAPDLSFFAHFAFQKKDTKSCRPSTTYYFHNHLQTVIQSCASQCQR